MLEPEINTLPAGAPHFDPKMWHSSATEPETSGGIDSPLLNFNQCFHYITPGHRCNAPALRGEYPALRTSPAPSRFSRPAPKPSSLIQRLRHG